MSERENAALGEFTGGLLKALPNLRAFALSLHNNPHKADDLVQDTVVRAWEKRHTFETGTNLNAWLFTIMRNAFFSEHRKRFREVEDVDGIHASRQACGPTQMDGLETAALQRALACLSPEQREALLLVGGQGMSYDEAAAVCGNQGRNDEEPGQPRPGPPSPADGLQQRLVRLRSRLDVRDPEMKPRGR